MSSTGSFLPRILRDDWCWKPVHCTGDHSGTLCCSGVLFGEVGRPAVILMDPRARGRGRLQEPLTHGNSETKANVLRIWHKRKQTYLSEDRLRICRWYHTEEWHSPHTHTTHHTHTHTHTHPSPKHSLKSKGVTTQTKTLIISLIFLPTSPSPSSAVLLKPPKLERIHFLHILGITWTGKCNSEICTWKRAKYWDELEGSWVPIHSTISYDAVQTSSWREGNRTSLEWGPLAPLTQILWNENCASFRCDVIAAILENDNKRFLISFYC